jgi:hypothetical protein
VRAIQGANEDVAVGLREGDAIMADGQTDGEGDCEGVGKGEGEGEGEGEGWKEIEAPELSYSTWQHAPGTFMSMLG